MEKFLTGIDVGNIKTKGSYLHEGEIVSFDMPSVIARYEGKASDVQNLTVESDGKSKLESRLFVEINSEALDEQNNEMWLVGDYAKVAPKDFKVIQPEENDSQDKRNSLVHKVMTITSLAVAAIKAEKYKSDEPIDIPFSGGLPISEHKKSGGHSFLNQLRGKHTVKLLDGPLKDTSVTFVINGGDIHVEGITSVMALRYTIQTDEEGSFKLEKTDLAKKLGNKFLLNDLGGGTLDDSVFDENGLNPFLSKSESLGTNQYIDRMIDEINQIDDPKHNIKSRVERTDKGPFSTRDAFMQTVVKPVIDDVLEQHAQKVEVPIDQVEFKFDWGRFKNVDVTDIVLKHMKEYADEAINAIDDYSFEVNAEQIILVGGGLLFGWLYHREHDFFMTPDDLKTSPFITSRSYLIANYLKHKQPQPAQ